jgi:hypothetical protein
MGKRINLKKASAEEYLAYLQQKCSMLSLEKLQKLTTYHPPAEFLDKALQSLGGDQVSEKELKALKKLVERDMKKIQATIVPTNYQERFLFSILQEYAKIVVSIAKQFNLQIPRKIVIGTLLTGNVNALAIKVPSGGIIVALDYGLFLFIHLLAKAISEFFPEEKSRNNKIAFSTKDEDITRSLSTNKEWHARFVEVLLAYVVLGNPMLARQYFQKGFARSMLSSVLRSSAEFFVVAHEYSHLILDHSAIENLRQRNLLGQVHIDEIVRNWKDELAADNLALQMTLEFGQRRGYDLALSYVGIDFLFSCMEIVEQASGLEPSVTHPPADDKRELLREWLMHNFEAQSKGALELGKTIQRLIAELWRRNKPLFERARTALISKFGQ